MEIRVFGRIRMRIRVYWRLAPSHIQAGQAHPHNGSERSERKEGHNDHHEEEHNHQVSS